MKKASLLNKRNPKKVNTQKHKKVLRELTKIYQREQVERIQCRINTIRNSVDYHDYHEVNEKKISSIAKLKAAGQE